MKSTPKKRSAGSLFILCLISTLFFIYLLHTEKVALQQFQTRIEKVKQLKQQKLKDQIRVDLGNLLENPPRVYFLTRQKDQLSDTVRLELALLDQNLEDQTRLRKILNEIKTEPALSQANILLQQIEDQKRLAMADQLVAEGKWQQAESVYSQHLNATKASLPHRLIFHRILIQQGRAEEARRIYQDGVFALDQPEDGLASLWVMDVQEPTVGEWTSSVKQAETLAPQDRRVILASAFLSRSSGQFEQAENQLKKLIENSPSDPVLIFERIQLGIAKNDTNTVISLINQVELNEFTAIRIAAWLAQKTGNINLEQSLLKKYIELVPADRRSLSRLAEIALSQENTETYQQLQKAKSDAEETFIKYTRLCRKASPLTPELSRQLAQTSGLLGLSFETWAWTELAAGNSLRQSGYIEPLKKRCQDWLGPEYKSLWNAEQRIAESDSNSEEMKIHFQDQSKASGLEDFVHRNQSESSNLVPPLSSSGGLGLIDYDNDGLEDVYLVQSGVFPSDPQLMTNQDKLFRNLGNGKFRDVSEETGIQQVVPGFGHGVTVGDIDNDGFSDIFLTRWRSYRLLKNLGNGRFVDITDKAGLGGERDWPTSAAFADLDNDGDLDLYVCHYMEWIEGKHYPCIDPSRPNTYDCRPRDFPSLQDHLFRNDHGIFMDVSQESGIAQADQEGRGLGVVAIDVNNDQRVDLFVANDTTANFLFINQGNMKFEESAFSSGVAANGQGGFQAGMGVAASDFNQDGWPDLAVTNFFNESTTLFQNLGNGLFVDRTASQGVTASSRFRLGFGIVFADFDLDGLADFMTANGHVTDGRPAIPWKMPLQIFQNRRISSIRHQKSANHAVSGSGVSQHYVDVSSTAGTIFQKELLARGLVATDLDLDGRIDVLVQSQNDPTIFLQNNTKTANNWLCLDLRGTTSNSDAVGCRIEMTSESNTLTTWRTGGGSFQSAPSDRIHIGLGRDSIVKTLKVTWPTGSVSLFANLQSNRIYEITEGKEEAVSKQIKK